MATQNTPEGLGIAEGSQTILNSSTPGRAFTSQINAADRLIRKFGGTVTLIRTTEGEFDPVTQERQPALQSALFRAAILPPGKSAEYRIGSIVGRNLIELHMAQKGQSMQPMPGDQVRWSNYDWTIIWATTYDPSGAGAIYSKAYAER